MRPRGSQSHLRTSADRLEELIGLEFRLLVDPEPPDPGTLGAVLHEKLQLLDQLAAEPIDRRYLRRLQTLNRALLDRLPRQAMTLYKGARP